MNFNDEEIAKTKGKMYAITTFAVIGTIIIFILIQERKKEGTEL